MQMRIHYLVISNRAFHITVRAEASVTLAVIMYIGNQTVIVHATYTTHITVATSAA